MPWYVYLRRTLIYLEQTRGPTVSGAVRVRSSWPKTVHRRACIPPAKYALNSYTYPPMDVHGAAIYLAFYRLLSVKVASGGLNGPVHNDLRPGGCFLGPLNPH